MEHITHIDDFLLNEGETYIKGLYQAKAGDYISIGTRGRSFAKIAKVLPTDKLVDSDGNIFGRNGVIIRRIAGWAKYVPKGSITSAKIITQKEFDKDYKKIKVDYIKDNIADEDIATIEEILLLMKGRQANTLNISRFD